MWKWTTSGSSQGKGESEMSKKSHICIRGARDRMWGRDMLQLVRQLKLLSRVPPTVGSILFQRCFSAKAKNLEADVILDYKSLSELFGNASYGSTSEQQVRTNLRRLLL